MFFGKSLEPATHSGLAELVEAPSFLSSRRKEDAAFDRISQAGDGTEAGPKRNPLWGIAVAGTALMLIAATNPPQDTYQPTYSVPAPPAPANGSIFQPANGYAPLTSGQRAAQVGDVLTIVLTERTQAAATAGTQTQRDGGIGLRPPTTGILSRLFSSSDTSAGGGSNFGGNGQTTQSNQLSGEISVTVTEVHPNGTMVVRGEKRLRLNRGNEFIQVQGLVRPADINPENRVASTRLADARITYSGRGEIARAAREGWLLRFFNLISPF